MFLCLSFAPFLAADSAAVWTLVAKKWNGSSDFEGQPKAEAIKSE
jgi:hypothetical protein